MTATYLRHAVTWNSPHVSAGSTAEVCKAPGAGMAKTWLAIPVPPRLAASEGWIAPHRGLSNAGSTKNMRGTNFATH